MLRINIILTQDPYARNRILTGLLKIFLNTTIILDPIPRHHERYQRFSILAIKLPATREGRLILHSIRVSSQYQQNHFALQLGHHRHSTARDHRLTLQDAHLHRNRPKARQRPQNMHPNKVHAQGNVNRDL